MVHSMDSQICLKVESLYVGKYTAERWNFHQLFANEQKPEQKMVEF